MLLRIVVLMAGTLLPVPVRGAQTIEMRWNELTSLQGQEIQVVSPAGERIEGRLAAVEPDALVLRRGRAQQRVERASVKALDYRRSRQLFRWIGLAGGGAAAWYVLDKRIAEEWNSTSDTQTLAIAIAAPLAGFTAGAVADGRRVLVRIVPD